MMAVDAGPPAAIAPGTVKIDGLREPAHAVAAVEAGADLVGFIFAPARRRISVDQARRCIEAARAAAERPIGAVGVFVDADGQTINRMVDAAGLDLVQLHGGEPPALLARLTRPVVKAFRPPAGTLPAMLAAEVDRFLRIPNAPVAVLIDGYAPGAAGGTGIRADWSLAAEIGRHCPLVLAGGLTPENVAAAIAAVRPLAVDVSSGVETDGEKDGAKIAAFVAAAKRAFAAGV